jgi:putative FmdB family regulatory protein
MPLYDYTCRKCQHTFEKHVNSRTTTQVACPNCQSGELDRLIGLPGVVRVTEGPPATNCRGDGPPCGAPWCGRKT